MKSQIKTATILAAGCGLGFLSFILLVNPTEVKNEAAPGAKMVGRAATSDQETRARSVSRASETMKRLEARSRALTKKRNEKLAKDAATLSSTEGFSQHQLESARNSVNEMIAASGTIYTQKIREEIMSELLESPGTVELFKKTLNDVRFAKNAFGDDQGKMRHFAVETLSYMAKSGNTQPLRSTLASVTRNLSKRDDTVTQGEIEDLNELVIAYSKNTPRENLSMQTISDLGYSDELPAELANAWQSSLFIGAWKRSGDLNASQKFIASIFK